MAPLKSWGDDYNHDSLRPSLEKNSWRLATPRFCYNHYVTLVSDLPVIFRLLKKRSPTFLSIYLTTILDRGYFEFASSVLPSSTLIASSFTGDRRALSLGLVTAKFSRELLAIQHGTFNLIGGMSTSRADRISVCFGFSIPYVDYYFSNGRAKTIVIPERVNLAGDWVLPNGNDSDAKFVVFAASPDMVEANKAIIRVISDALGSEVFVHVKLHPRDSPDCYENIWSSRVKHTTIKSRAAVLCIGGISTVLAEAYSVGVPVVVIKNPLKDQASDFTESNPAAIVTTLPELRARLREASWIG